MAKTLELNNNDRVKHWDTRVSQANAAFNKPLAITYECLRELARHQAVVSSRQRATGVGDDGTYCDVIEPGKPVIVSHKAKVETVNNTKIEGVEETIESIESHDNFGVVLRVQTDESGEVPPLIYGNIRFQAVAADTALPRANLATGEDVPSVDKQVIESLTAGLRGSEELAFMYTPFVMMIQRLLSVDLVNVNINPRPEIQMWSMQAIAGDYLVSAELDFDKVCTYFGL